MDLTLDSEAGDLWQDAVDLLETQGLEGPQLAMLAACEPVRLEGGTLYVETSSRIVQKKLLATIPNLENCLTQAAFEETHLQVDFVRGQAKPAINTNSTMTRERAERLAARVDVPVQPTPSLTIQQDSWDEEQVDARHAAEGARRMNANPLVEDITETDSKLTFERFVRGDENEFAYQAALQVANGENRAYNPLFIYGKSGLGKTHLLRAIQNYIAKNDPTRICVYKDASAFTNDYTSAMQHREKNARDVLIQNYSDIDVLIIDDIQNMAGKAGTIGFFFDTFNTLVSAGKSIVLAADRAPAQLGMGPNGFDERVTSRMASGFSVSIQTPSYELKYRLISAFCQRAYEDAQAEHVGTPVAMIDEANLKVMSELAGTNIRVIEGFCSKCLFLAGTRERQGRQLTREDLVRQARETWPNGRRQITIEEIQQYIEKYYDVSHTDLVGNKRSKEYKEPRHVAIWLCRELTDSTLAEIGKHFGGRSHATIMHSVGVVESARHDDKNFFDRVAQIQDGLSENK